MLYLLIFQIHSGLYCGQRLAGYTADDLHHSCKPSKATLRPTSKPKSTTNAESISQESSTSSIDRHDYSKQRIADYVTDPVDPNPPYTYYTVEESIKDHTTNMMAYFNDFDATMAQWEG